jgi:serine/threonine protein kinase
VRDLADELLQAKVKTRLFGGDHAPRLGRLVILERIGAGAMGTVYAAYDPRLDRRVAVKVMHASGADDNARVLREARALGKLAHPNVVAIFDADEVDGVVHVVMELATGVPLRAWIGEHRAWRDVVRVLREAGAGLAAAHRAGLVHRDVKPDNILISDDRARLLDFGLAGAHDDTDDRPGGTPSYMAPEVLAGEPATAASDQFSFAVTLYEALYGRRPHAGTTRDELRRAALAASSAPARRSSSLPEEDANDEADDDAHAAGASSEGGERPPAWVHAVVARGLAAEPAARFASMEELVAALGRDPRKRRRATAIAAAVATCAALVGGVAGAWAYRRAGRVDACDPEERVGAVWSEERAAEIRVRMSGAPWGAGAVAALERNARQWQASFRGVCEATRVRGEQSDRLLELRMRCLDRTLERFGALVTALGGRLDAAGRAEVAPAVAQLPPPEACATLADENELALPLEPERRARAIAVERDLDRAWAEFALARYAEARERVRVIDERSRDLDDAPATRSRVLLLAAAVESRSGEPARARATLDRALEAAARARAPAIEHGVWTRLLRHELFAGAPARVVEWAPFARAAALRAGLEGAELDGIAGEAERDAHQLAAARALLERALASRDALRPEQRAVIEMNLGSVELELGASARAAPILARAFDDAHAALGADHPTLGLYLDKLAEADRARGRIRAALAHHDRSLALRTAAFGDRDRAAATALFHRAETLLEAGLLTRATADLEAARAIRASLLGARSARLGEIDAVLADVAEAAGRTADAAALRTRAISLDPRLDLDARRPEPHTDAARADAGRAADAALSIVHAAAIARRLAASPGSDGLAIAMELYARWRSAGPVDATLSLPVADALLAAGDRANARRVYADALGALADEPSRARLRATRALAELLDGDAAATMAAAARELAARLPELVH